MRATLFLALLVGAGCDRPGRGDGATDAGGAAADAGVGSPDCAAPDMLILLDRTMSMHKRPDGSVPPDTAEGRAESKWSIAVAAIEGLTEELEVSVQFGLALFPRNPGGDVCVTLSQRIAGTRATNPECEPGEIVVDPQLSSSAAIAAAIDPGTTPLCGSTPIGAGFGAASESLAARRVADRDQYVVFVGDGRDTCDRGLAVASVQELAAAGVHTFVIAFDGSSGGIDAGLLDDLACAGRTATGFPAPCQDDGSGDFTARRDHDGGALFLLASDAAALTDALQSIASDICCGCVE